MNSSYYHKIANGRKRKNTIHSLKMGGEVIEGNENLIAHASEFYKELFGPGQGNIFHLDPKTWSQEEEMSEAYNDTLCRDFTEAEVKDALFDMAASRALGPNNIPAEFYQVCWDIVKNDIMSLFHHFHRGALDVKCLNYGVITLLPKVSGAGRIQQFRPICLLRCPYKMIMKVLDRRAACVADALISSTQNAFIKGRNIMDGILALHEILNYTHVSKKVGIVLKLDFEKAYDKVNWDFLLECHSMRGFSETWCGWIKKILYDGTVSIKLTNCVGPNFQSAKGVRQGDPHSPFLFNLAAECLAKMIKNAQRNKLIVGLAADLIPDGIVVLQYADDTIICIEHDVEKAVNLKLSLYIFEMMSGLKANYQKSEIFTVGGDENVIKTYTDMFNCDIGKFPIKYLGMPVSYTALKNSDWDFIVEKYMK
uniref:Reverse transcriptase domain-containing protein n=1 Tax=Hordeum vulgare subsp. vulgare TaxID=112509 RepID=A0A8I6WDK1_HORVV